MLKIVSNIFSPSELIRNLGISEFLHTRCYSVASVTEIEIFNLDLMRTVDEI